MYNHDQTIAAISTPPGKGGVALIRVSGKDAVEIAGKCLSLRRGGSLSELPARRVAYADFLDGDGAIDDVLVTVFRAPTHAETDSFLQGVRPPQPTPTEPTEPTPVVTEPTPAPIPATTETTGKVWVWTVVIGIAALVAGAAVGYFVHSAILNKRKD